jgi:hypothetical protein
MTDSTVFSQLTQPILTRTVFTFARTLRTPTTFALFQFCFFSERQYPRPSSHEHFFLADYVLYSIIADAIRTILGVHLAFMASAVKLQGHSLLQKMFIGRWPWILSSREKKQNSNRVRGVEVLSILPRVKNAKRVIFYPNCINGLAMRLTLYVLQL